MAKPFEIKWKSCQTCHEFANLLAVEAYYRVQLIWYWKILSIPRPSNGSGWHFFKVFGKLKSFRSSNGNQSWKLEMFCNSILEGFVFILGLQIEGSEIPSNNFLVHKFAYQLLSRFCSMINILFWKSCSRTFLAQKYS